MDNGTNPEIYYFGNWPGQGAQIRLYDQTGVVHRTAPERLDRTVRAARQDHVDGPAVAVWHWHDQEGFTTLTFRPTPTAPAVAFIARGHYTSNAMCQLAEQTFRDVWPATTFEAVRAAA